MDVIALLAVVGAMAVGEELAAAVIAVMLTSGRSLEDWSAGRAARELRALLERRPDRAHRYGDEELEVVEVDVVSVGDRLMVAAGEVIPVDGTLRSARAVIDESALTGEALPAERSGVAAGPVPGSVAASLVGEGSVHATPPAVARSGRSGHMTLPDAM